MNINEIMYSVIRKVTNNGYNVIAVNFGNNTEYYLVSKFEPTQTSTTGNIDYNSFSGYTITQLITNANITDSDVSIMQKLQNLINDQQFELNIKFNKNMDYLFFSRS